MITCFDEQLIRKVVQEPSEILPASSLNELKPQIGTGENKDSKEGNFLEIDKLWPSQHFACQKDMLRNELYNELLKLDFQTGVFHIEARIQNSDTRYVIKDGI